MKNLFLFFVLLTTVVVPATASDDRRDPPAILTVSGQAEVTIPATLARVALAVETTGKTAEAAQKQAAEKANAVIGFLKSENVKKLQTTQMSLNPDFQFDNGKNKLIGYRAVQSLSFETTAEQAGRQIDQAVAKGASRVDSLSFMADEDSRRAAEHTALKQAADRAKAKAKSVLEALGLTWTRIAFIDVNPNDGPSLRPMARTMKIQAMSASDASPSPTVAGEDSVSVTIQMGIVYQ